MIYYSLWELFVLLYSSLLFDDIVHYYVFSFTYSYHLSSLLILTYIIYCHVLFHDDLLLLVLVLW